MKSMETVVMELIVGWELINQIKKLGVVIKKYHVNNKIKKKL